MIEQMRETHIHLHWLLREVIDARFLQEAAAAQKLDPQPLFVEL